MLTWMAARELLDKQKSRRGHGDSQIAATTATPAADGGALHPSSSDEVLSLPVTISADDSKGLFTLHFGPHGGLPGEGEPTAAVGAATSAHKGGGAAAVGGAAKGAGAALTSWGRMLEELVEAVGEDVEDYVLKDPAKQQGVAAAAPAPAPAPADVPPLSIVILIAGTRGDVQPFIPLGRALQACGHRVRLASHGVYRKWVEGFGLEFYPLGGDPEVLSEFIVRNRGVVPRLNEIPLAVDSTEQVRLVLHSTWPACTQPDPDDPSAKPFTAQAIIANPPAYGHIHCAEKLGIPLQMVFTMPYTPTSEFACPLAQLPVPNRLLNKLSYSVIFDFIFTGMLHMINSFRQHDLGLPPIRSGNHGGMILDVHKAPFMYCWSSAVVPRPADWPAWADVVGYFFLEESTLSAYEPPAELAAFLAEGPPPVYIGFGSLKMDHPEALTTKIVDAAAAAGVRLILSKGWGGLGEGLEAGSAPPGVFLLDKPCPHDWLFGCCSAVVHHGGAGTTAAGLKAGRPTCIIPVFGDQHFWGGAVHRMGLGPAPIPIDSLTTERLTAALRKMQEPGVQAAAAAAAEQINKEDGVAAAVACFHRRLPLAKLRAGKRVEWDLSSPQVSNVLYEAGAGLVNVWKRPIKGAKRHGVVGAVEGAGRGLVDLGYRPAKGVVLSAEALAHMASAKAHGGRGGKDEEAAAQ